MNSYDITINVKVDADDEQAVRDFLAESINCVFFIEEIAIEDSDD